MGASQSKSLKKSTRNTASTSYCPKTLGIEIEFFIVYKPTELANLPLHFGNVQSAAHLVALELANKGIPADHLRGHLLNRDYKYWQIHGETNYLSMNEARAVPPGYVGEGIEVTSKKFNFQTDKWQEEVCTVLQCIKNLYHMRFYAYTNQSCGLHVHVGSIPEDTLTNLVRNLVLTTTAFERCIDEIHTVRRITDQPNDQFVCNPWSFVFRRDPSLGDGIASWLLEIGKMEGIAEFCSRFIGADSPHSYLGRYTAYNLLALRETGWGHPANTIEFRQHEGTLHAIEILTWATFVVELCSFCEMVSDDGLMNLLAENVQDRKFRLAQLLERIGASPMVLRQFAHRIPANDVPAPELKRAKWWRESEYMDTDTPPELQDFVGVLKKNSKDLSHPAAVARAIDRKYFRGDYGYWIDPKLLRESKFHMHEVGSYIPNHLISAEHRVEWTDQHHAQQEKETHEQNLGSDLGLMKMSPSSKIAEFIEEVPLVQDCFKRMDERPDIRTNLRHTRLRKAPCF